MIFKICFFLILFIYKCIIFGFYILFYINYICVNIRINLDVDYKFYILIDKKICVFVCNNIKVNEFNWVRCKEY